MTGVEPPDAIDVVRDEVDAAVAACLEISLEPRRRRLQQQRVEPAAILRSQLRQVVEERPKVERAPRRRSNGWCFLRISLNTARTSCNERPHGRTHHCSSIDPAHDFPFDTSEPRKP